MKINNYTVGSARDYETINSLDTAQVVLSRRIFPSNRNYPAIFLDQKNHGIKTKIMVHYDYLYIASRIAILSDSIKTAVLNEIKHIVNYSATDNRILGIVSHTDFPIKKDVYKKGMPIEEAYTSRVYDREKLHYYCDEQLWSSLIKDSFVELAKAIKSDNPIKVYLENTTKVLDTIEPLGHIGWLIESASENSDKLGVCLDTEHNFAVTGDSLEKNKEHLLYAKSLGVSTMVHLNTIPFEVTPGSLKDRHSSTTLFECSQFTIEQYFDFIEFLEENNIPWVREVDDETMKREQEQLLKWKK